MTYGLFCVPPPVMTAEEQLSDQFPLAASTFEIVFDENRNEHPQIASEKKNMKANTMLKPFFFIFCPQAKNSYQ